jgi:hypothetical protein
MTDSRGTGKLGGKKLFLQFPQFADTAVDGYPSILESCHPG